VCACVCMCMFVFVRVCVCVCVCVRLCVFHIHISLHLCVCACVCICAWTSVFVCVHMCVRVKHKSVLHLHSFLQLKKENITYEYALPSNSPWQFLTPDFKTKHNRSPSKKIPYVFLRVSSCWPMPIFLVDSCTNSYVSHTHISLTNTLVHTRCNTLQHAATRCNTLQHAATRCNTLSHTHISLKRPKFVRKCPQKKQKFYKKIPYRLLSNVNRRSDKKGVIFKQNHKIFCLRKR